MRLRYVWILGVVLNMLAGGVGCSRQPEVQAEPPRVARPALVAPPPTPANLAEEVTQTRGIVEAFPAAWKLVISEEVTVVTPDSLHSTADWIGVALFYHLPSASSVALNRQGEVTHTHYNTPEAQAQMEAVLADEATMQRVWARVRRMETPSWEERLRSWLDQRR